MNRCSVVVACALVCASLSVAIDAPAAEFQFESAGTGEVLATLTVTELPGGFDEVSGGLSFTAAGAAFFGFEEGPYAGGFDLFDGFPFLPDTVDVFLGGTLLADEIGSPFAPVQAVLLDEDSVPTSTVVPMAAEFLIGFGSATAATNGDPSDDIFALTTLSLFGAGEATATGSFVFVPEPASFGLAGLAFLGLAVSRARRG